ncbi:MAG: deoxyribodipyrimidine photo-lyase, partial [Sinomicrobium sp.]|nr:deoxyribodipyrimidine photo-lyase [Sinomicrobium sp.]
MKKINVFWFRRDLRLEDNAGLYHALKSEHPVLPLFIFDTHILDDLENKADGRVEFIHQEVSRLHEELQKLGSTLLVKYGTPEKVWRELVDKYEIEAVFTNRDYEPSAKQRDRRIEVLLNKKDITFCTYKDQVIFEGLEIKKSDGDPYVVFTPYSRTWKEKLSEKEVSIEEKNEETATSFYFQSYPTEQYLDNLLQVKPVDLPSLK